MYKIVCGENRIQFTTIFPWT